MAKFWKFERDEQKTKRGIYMSLAMGGISHEQFSALTCRGPTCLVDKVLLLNQV
jgi:hypothetical protein